MHLRNRRLHLEWDDTTGNLLRLVDVRSGHNFASERAGGSSLWHLQLDEGPPISAEDASTFEWQALPGARKEGILMRWRGFDARGQQDLQAEATVTLDDDGLSRWRLSLRGLQAELRAVHFPRAPDLQRAAGQEVLALPVGSGRLIREPRQDGRCSRGWTLFYPGPLTMQCMGLYSTSGPGLYLACEDGAGYSKAFVWDGNSDQATLGWAVLHFPSLPLEPGGQYVMPYDAVIGTFEGDWLTVAEIYRAWALEQAWARNSRLRQGAVPAWLRETVLWAWNRGTSHEVVPGALALKRASGVPTNLLWHWWHNCPYDVGFPEYLPPREGADSFRQAVVELQRSGVHAFPYVNGRLWGLRTESWVSEGAERGAAIGPDGSIYEEVYNTFTGAPMAPMCVAHSLWQDKIRFLLGALANDLGSPGIYLDQAAIARPVPCFNARHGHPLGGGNHWVRGYHRMMQGVREHFDDGAVAVATEGCAEPYLDAFDAFLVLDPSIERYSATHSACSHWEAIPLFSAVYHGHALAFGSYSSLTEPPYDEKWPQETAPSERLKLLDRKFSAQLRVELARQLVWGSQLMVANLRPEHWEQRPEELAFVSQLARLAHAAPMFLRDGTLVRAPHCDVPWLRLPFITLSIYERSAAEVVHERGVPAAIAAAWQAPDGSVALIMVNISDEPVGLDVPLDPAQQWGLAGRWQAAIHGAEGTEAVSGPFRGFTDLEVLLPPHSARMIEVRSAGGMGAS
ncbi:MAG: hypothetical protein HPY83_00440 [Anaerolineae bacterium]|nr:hypothetical protein [Anaerolineae bacterium]